MLTAHLLIISAEKEAVVELMELLMSLEEVNNLVTNLWHEEVIGRERFRFQYMFLINFFSFFGQFLF